MPAATAPEPICDIRAQLRALLDPGHPKDTMWISEGTPLPDFRQHGLVVIESSGGTLATNNHAKAEYFGLTQTDDALAEVLGYPPKSSIDPNRAIVLQACDLAGRVITELTCDRDDEQKVMLWLRGHGEVYKHTLGSALLRRGLLVFVENG